MADSTEVETKVEYLVLLASAVITLIPSLVIHSFIIGVNVNDWWKGRSLSTVDYILTSLGMSRMCSQFANISLMFLGFIFFRNVDFHVSLDIMDAVYAFFTYTNIWLTAMLSIVFCLKISNLQTRLFLYLRRMIVQRTVYFIVATVLLSAFNALLPLWIPIPEVTEGGARNTTKDLLLGCSSNYFVYNYSIGVPLPLLFYYISSILLFTSLYYHTTRMKRSSNLTINLETYYSVMKLVSFTLIYHTIYFVGHFICDFYYFFYCVTLPWFYMCLDLLPVLHSSYLIYRTAKLRNKMSEVLQNITNFLF